MAQVSFQIDVLRGVTIAARTLSQLLQAGSDDALNPMIVQPIELLGQWLMVDGNRIQQGERALKHRSTQQRMKLPFSISKSSISHLAGQHRYLTAVFLFIVCCSLCLDSLATGSLIYEMMDLAGILKTYGVNNGLVCEFVEIMTGNREYFTNDTFLDFYDDLSQAVWLQCGQQRLDIPDLYESVRPKDLAKLFYEVFDFWHNADYHEIHLRGSQMGIWISCLFAWLKPQETRVFVGDFMVYPSHMDEDNDDAVRLVIQIQAAQDSGKGKKRPWHVVKWKETENIEQVFDFSQQRHGVHQQHWKGARLFIQQQRLSKKAMDAIGQLSGALVVLATENGTVLDSAKQKEARVSEICSTQYTEKYPTIMTRFGWPKLEQKQMERRHNLIETLESGLGELRETGHDNAVESLFRWTKRLDESHYEKYRERMFPDGSINEDMREITGHAINLSAQVLQQMLFMELPKHAPYYPISIPLLTQHSWFLRGLFLRSGKPTYSWLREQAVTSLMPGVDKVEFHDLAWARDGYVVYSTSLIEDDVRTLVDKQRVAGLKVSTGILKADHPQGRYVKLTEPYGPLQSASLNHPQRGSARSDLPVQLYSENGDFTGVLEGESGDEWGMRPKYTLANDDLKKTINLATFLGPPIGTEQLSMYGLFQNGFPVYWWKSVEAVIFSTIVDTLTSRLAQQRSLAKEWEMRGLLGDRLQWYSVGGNCQAGVRYITKTSEDETLRFFIAGHIPAGYKLFIRRNRVPLTHCVMEAFAMKEMVEPDWVILS